MYVQGTVTLVQGTVTLVQGTGTLVQGKFTFTTTFPPAALHLATLKNRVDPKLDSNSTSFYKIDLINI